MSVSVLLHFWYDVHASKVICKLKLFFWVKVGWILKAGYKQDLHDQTQLRITTMILLFWWAQSAGAIENTDCIPAEE